MRYAAPRQRVHSKGLRVWHWLDAIVVISLIVTFFLRDALVSHGRYLVTRLAADGAAVTFDTARPAIREMVRDLWAWHINLGYALAALLVFRAVVCFIDGHNPFLECWGDICRLRRPFDFRAVHSTLVRTGYVAFYVLQLFMVLSGLTLVWGESLGVSKDIRHTVGDVHEAVMWFFLAFSVLHVLGVFIAENTGDPGIVSAMINGGKKSRD